jgi:myosin heavy subunit
VLSSSHTARGDQLLAGMNDDEKRSLGIDSTTAYTYVQSELKSSDTDMDDAALFHQVRRAMGFLGMSEDVQIAIFHLLVTVLTIGNIQFELNEVGDVVIATPSVRNCWAAVVLMVDGFRP